MDNYSSNFVRGKLAFRNFLHKAKEKIVAKLEFLNYYSKGDLNKGYCPVCEDKTTFIKKSDW